MTRAFRTSEHQSHDDTNGLVVETDKASLALSSDGGMKVAEKGSRTCFIIGPIGQHDREERRRADQILRHIIEPACQDCGYETLRADKISEPGLITSQIVEHLMDDPLVIADLTGNNANVFYELAIRHAVRGPVVQIIREGERIPFDVAATRTIPFDHHDLDSAAHCKEEIARQIRVVEKDPSQVDSPISVAIDLKMLRSSDKPVEKAIAELASQTQEVKSMLAEIGSGLRRSASTFGERGGLVSGEGSYSGFVYGAGVGRGQSFAAWTPSDSLVSPAVSAGVTCANCGTPIQVPGGPRPMEVSCPKCSTKRVVP